MKPGRGLGFLAVLIALFVATSTHSAPTAETNAVAPPPQKETDVIADWSVEQKVGQLFMIGFPQSMMDSQLRDFISKNHLGAFILFKRNLGDTPQIRSLTGELLSLARSSSGADALISVDQEGGLVSRLPIKPAMASGWALGQTEDPVLARDVGRELGKYLRELGFNMNLSPVLDLGDGTKPSFIGARALGSNPENVATVGYNLSRGLVDEKILPTAKHFPGLGPIRQDPHRTTISRTEDPEAFKKTDLLPFAEFSKLGPNAAVMASQLSYPFLDPSAVPTPFSKKILTDLLRVDLGFEGLVITDDLQMKGSRLILAPEDAALESLKAGADLIMLTWSFVDQQKAIQRVVDAVKKGELPQDLLDQKVRRILRTKSAFALKKSSRSIASVESFTPKNWASLDLKILDHNLLLAMKDFKTRAPKALREGRKPVCVYSSNPKFLISFNGAASKFPHRLVRIEEKHTPADLKKNFQDLGCAWGVLGITGKKTAVFAASLKKSERAPWMVVNMGAPHWTAGKTGFLDVVTLGFHHDHTGFRVAQLLSQKITQPSPTASNQ